MLIVGPVTMGDTRVRWQRTDNVKMGSRQIACLRELAIGEVMPSRNDAKIYYDLEGLGLIERVVRFRLTELGEQVLMSADEERTTLTVRFHTQKR
jgi:hypothetical protein